MKRVLILALIGLVLISFSSAECDLSISMINQDPYPAVPGDYVKVVFQVAGIEDPSCKEVSFELLEQYPIVFDPDQKRIYEIEAGTYSKDFSSFLIAPYKVRVDEDGLEGANPLEIKYRYNYQGKPNTSYHTSQFDLEVQDTRVDFEIAIKNYDYVTEIMTLEVLNIGESDIEALSLEIPNQNNVEIKGASKNIVGDLDSNEYTTTDFEVRISDGDFNVALTYSDEINVRRKVEKTLTFDSSYFTNRIADQKTTSTTTYIIWLAIILGITYFGYKKYKKKKK